MTKISSGELHRNDNADMAFGSAIASAVHDVRQCISSLATSRKADEYAPGAIHALRKLCDGEKSLLGIKRLEVEEWKTCFDAWFKRVKRHFPAKLSEEFSANAEEDFRVILDCAVNLPEHIWRRDAVKRYFKVDFRSDDYFKAACAAAKQKHPVKLGHALREYIKRCVAELMDEESPEAPVVERTNFASAESLVIRFMRHKAEVSIIVNDFECFDSPAAVEQGNNTTAYDIEEAVKVYLGKHSPKAVAKLTFDCESSMFVVRTTDVTGLTKVVGALVRLANDPKLRRK